MRQIDGKAGRLRQVGDGRREVDVGIDGLIHDKPVGHLLAEQIDARAQPVGRKLAHSAEGVLAITPSDVAQCLPVRLVLKRWHGIEHTLRHATDGDLVQDLPG